MEGVKALGLTLTSAILGTLIAGETVVIAGSVEEIMLHQLAFVAWAIPRFWYFSG
jgi:hypothetical protein